MQQIDSAHSTSSRPPPPDLLVENQHVSAVTVSSGGGGGGESPAAVVAAAATGEKIGNHHVEPRYVVVPMEAHHLEQSEYRGNLLTLRESTRESISDMPDLELRDLIMKKKFGASPDRYLTTFYFGPKRENNKTCLFSFVA